MSMMAPAVLESSHAPVLAALAPALADDATPPIRIRPVADGVVAAYSPAQLDRASAWQLLTDLFGNLRDVTPDWVIA